MGTKIYLNGSGHMTKMDTKTIYMVKKTLKILLQYLKADDLGLWYIASLDLGSNLQMMIKG